MTDLLVAGGFLAPGWRKDDNRARTTASEITSGLVSLGVYTQLLEPSFGRQTPNESTEPRGRWRPCTWSPLVTPRAVGITVGLPY